MMQSKKSDTSHARGVWAEEKACAYLKAQGYSVIYQRYKTKFGEIDIVANKKDMLCFVEVKVRPSTAEALESVTWRARQRIEQSALFFLSEYPEYIDFDMRFDVIAINTVDGSAFEVTHLDNAWEAGS